MSAWPSLLAGAGVVLLVLWDAFETMILPRRVTLPVRLSQVINLVVWQPWRAVVRRTAAESRRERYFGFYGPLSVLLMLVIWAVALVVGFALMGAGLGSAWAVPGGPVTFRTDLYVSGTTLFTLGLGDVHPLSALTRLLVVAEAGTGFGFLAVGISYLPVLYQSFSRREVQITLIDAWAGSPPSAVELLRRLAVAGAMGEIQVFLKEWERWCAELMEGHISYPQVAYFRSQHGHQSWVSALTAVLDVSALVLVGIQDVPPWRARMTFAIARHAAVDLGQILRAPPVESQRMSHDRCDQLIAALRSAGLAFEHGDDAARRLLHYRSLYEPYVAGLARELAMDLPPWIRDGVLHDNWEATPRTRVELHL
jgi:Ion channel